MATDKKKKEVKVRDLKPSKDAKGGAARPAGNTSRHSQDAMNRVQNNSTTKRAF